MTEPCKALVLVADDEPRMRALICASIEGITGGVLEAGDGDEAWKLLVQHRPRLALLDVQMPGRTGLELTRQIRGEDTLRETRVILISAKAQDEDVVAGMEAGADRYITKPFSVRALAETVEQTLARP